MKRITYRVELLEPALVTSLQGDPNSAVAFDYLPGSVLRGLWVSRYLALRSSDTSESTLQRLFFDGSTRYLNGYPLDADNQPGLPVPISWQRVKHEEDKIFDLAVDVPDDSLQWQSLPEPFYTQSDEDVSLIQPERNVMVHTRRTARFGRAMPTRQADGERLVLQPNEIPGAVYRYDALAAGQTFQAAIVCDHDADASTLHALILGEGRVSLGGSRSGGYGQAEISQVQVQVDEYDPQWDACGEGDDMQEGTLIVTLRSDLLVRDPSGQFVVDPDLVCQVLSKHLLVEHLVLKDAFLGSRLVGGFNRKWRLPLPQALAVRMGSVLVLQDPGCDPAVLEHLEARGIGERRAEGFGQVAFNRQQMAILSAQKNTRSADRSPFTISEKGVRDLAERMLARLLRQRLDQGLLDAANSKKLYHPPANAQISRLRSLVLEALYHPPGTGRICQALQSIEARSNVRRQFEHCTLSTGESLFSWLRELLQCEREGAWAMSDRHNEWRALLHLDRLHIDRLAIGGVRASIDDELRLEYVLRLIDLVLAHAARMHGKEK
ncbi:MAG TPA: hypothetical protein VGF67_06265 [Ktedonobacteraceae bacterium]|jgi:CRISPR-associated protein Csx10